MKSSDFKTIAKLHSQSITTGFLSTLGNDFLARLYQAISKHPESCVLVEQNTEGENVIKVLILISDKHIL